MESAIMEQPTEAILVSETPVKVITRLTDMGKRMDGVWMDPDDIIVEEGFNPRDFSLPENQASVETLKNEIVAAGGVLQPLWVRLMGGKDEKKAILIDGERRLRAVRLARAEGHDISRVPVIQKTAGVNDLMGRLILALTANEGRRLSQMEIGKTYIRLVTAGYDASEIAAKTGKSERYVRDAMDISNAPDDVKQMVKSGDVSQALAIKTVKETGAEGAAAALTTAVAAARASGKKKATAPKADKKLTKLQLIQGLIDEYDDIEPSALTLTKAKELLNDISAILDGGIDGN